MPHKKKLLAKTLYTYVEPSNDVYVRSIYKKLGFKSYSAYINALITRARATGGKKGSRKSA